MSLNMSSRRRRSPWGTVVFTAVLILMSMIVTYGCRQSRIDDCRDRGGRPLTPAVFSDQPHDVRCIEP